ncbi:MAG: FAD-binding oxidoreductase [Rhizobiales bacterium]|nr:FAD-binding oxidoreductase [Hyphomicrobiales bacterium]
MDARSPKLAAPSAETIDRLVAVVGEKYALRDAQEMESYVTEWRDRWPGRASLVLRPGSTQEVSEILKIANETQTGVVPQSGNTGAVGGQVPSPSGDEIVVSLERLNKILRIDALDNTIAVEAGCILQSVQEAAEEVDRLFPLRIGSQGSCQIGGNLGTNAGGIATLAYGNARDLALGLEVVMADGRIWNGMNRLRKNNTGYDLRDIFIGSEGTLGIITGAVLKLYPKPRDRAVALVGLSAPEPALELLALAQGKTGNGVVGFEIFPHFGMEIVERHTELRNPLGSYFPWYVIVEIAGGAAPGDLTPVLTSILEEAFEADLISDAALASSEAQYQMFWSMRERMSEVQKFEGGSIKLDTSVPVSQVPELIARGLEALKEAVPDARPLPYGHIGDGNIHFNISQPEGADTDAFMARWDELTGIINSIAIDMSGSISAEHGIGQSKTYMMPKVKSPLEMELLVGLKHMFDPNGILNPGKVLPS